MDRSEEFIREVCPDTAERGLVEAVVDDPSDEQLRLVYADWLEERGDHRSEFLRRRTQLHVLRAELAEWRSKFQPEWLALVDDPGKRFEELRQRISRFEEIQRGYRPFLKVEYRRGLFNVHFSGSLLICGDGEDVGCLWALLSQREVAPVVRSILIDGHQDRGGINGTISIELDCLLEGSAIFTNLTSFATERGEGIILGSSQDMYSEEGLVDRLLRKSPVLKSLTIPSAPKPTFFTGPPHPLMNLSVAAGFETEQFLLNLSRSTRFPNLRLLEYSDYQEHYVDNWRHNCTMFEEYRTFFSSPVGQAIERIVLNEVVLSEGEIQQLLAIRSHGVEIRRSQQID
jgi:uncharacterized protein (TIGR02996 family)